MSETTNDPTDLPTSIALGDGAIPVLCRAGARRAGPVLLIAPSAFGITDDLVGQMDELAHDAGLVVALDLFWRGDHGPLAYTDMRAVMARLQALDKARAFEDYRAVVAWARARPEHDGRVIGLGICFGGPFTFLAAAAGLLDGVVTWHGSRLETFIAEAAAITCPMALHFGERDRVVPLSAVDQIREAFAGRDAVEVVVHPGADHGFTHPAAPTWDPEAAAIAMRSARAMLGRGGHVS